MKADANISEKVYTRLLATAEKYERRLGLVPAEKNPEEPSAQELVVLRKRLAPLVSEDGDMEEFSAQSGVTVEGIKRFLHAFGLHADKIQAIQRTVASWEGDDVAESSDSGPSDSNDAWSEETVVEETPSEELETNLDGDLTLVAHDDEEQAEEAMPLESINSEVFTQVADETPTDASGTIATPSLETDEAEVEVAAEDYAAAPIDQSTEGSVSTETSDSPPQPEAPMSPAVVENALPSIDETPATASSTSNTWDPPEDMDPLEWIAIQAIRLRRMGGVRVKLDIGGADDPDRFTLSIRNK